MSTLSNDQLPGFRLARLPRLLLFMAIRNPEIREGVLGDIEQEFGDLGDRGNGPLRLQLLSLWATLAIACTFLLEPRAQRSHFSARGWFADIDHDVRFAFRGLVRARAFAVVAILSLGLGIGLNTALFTLVYATWLEPVSGVREADRITEILVTRRGSDMQEWSYPDFEDVRAAGTPIEDVAGWKNRDGTLTTAEASQRVNVMYVSANYFRTLGVIPERGRDFLPSEDVGPGQHPVAIVSHGLWQHRLGGDPGIVGRTITINRDPHTVVGVAPEAFRGHRATQEDTDLWVPMMQHPYVAGDASLAGDRGASWLLVIGRLRLGATLEQATAALQTVFARLESEYPATNEDRGARAAAFGPMPALGRSESLLTVLSLFVLSGLVLLIICGNVAGMVLARSASRDREVAVRMALGSSRARLVRLWMVEAAQLTLVGGSVGVLFAFWGLRALSLSSVPEFARADLSPNPAILGFSLVLILVTTLAVGLLPAARFSRPELVSSLKDETGGGGRRAGRVHRLAASAQTGIALLLIVTCSLFVRAVGTMGSRDLGFDPSNLLVTRMDLSLEGYDSPDQGGAFLDRVREAVASLPGVTSVSVSDGLPLDQVGNFVGLTRPDQDGEEGVRVQGEFTRAMEGYFQTIGTPILRGRGFETTDDRSSEPVVVVTQLLADRLWPGEEALGRHLRFSLTRDAPQDYTVVGIAPNVASSRATEEWPHVFVALRQQYRPRIMLVIRATTDPATLARSIQQTMLTVDPDLPVPPVITAESLVAQSTQGQRSMINIAGALGLLALILSAIGIYGVVAFTVARRTREIGLRMALGASRERVLGTVLRDAMWLAIPGLATGGALAVGAAFVMRSILLGVSPVDPAAFASAGGLLFAVVLLASVVPARRASRIDPMRALRSE